jgi:hypothetical protein
LDGSPQKYIRPDTTKFVTYNKRDASFDRLEMSGVHRESPIKSSDPLAPKFQSS